MLTDHMPSVRHSDEYIKKWAWQRGMDKYPKALVPLCEATTPLQPDLAVIHYDRRGAPVERIKREMALNGMTGGQ